VTQTLKTCYQVVYYEGGDRRIYWPADTSSSVLAAKLQEARNRGLSAHLAEVYTESKAA
jgi:hypothetical protein